MSASPFILMLVAVGGATGAVLRYLLERYTMQKRAMTFPLGVLIANVSASLIAGFAFARGTEWVVALVAGGFAGSLSTYSTFALDTVRIAGQGSRSRAVLNVVASVILGLGAATLGFALGAP
jgi:fluoride exporter